MPVPDLDTPLLPASRRSGAPHPLRRKKSAPTPVATPSRRRRLWHAALVLVAAVLAADALVGEKGLLVTVRARQAAGAESARLAALRQENARLREEKRRLNEDPATIEAEARRQLGLARPGEVMFILKDIRPSDGPRPGSPR